MKMKNRNAIITTTGGEYAVFTYYAMSNKEAHWQTILVDIDQNVLCHVCTINKHDALIVHSRLVEDPLGYLDDEEFFELTLYRPETWARRC